MIDGIGKGWLAPVAAANNREPARVAGRDPSPAPTGAGPVLSQIARDLSVSPPVDGAKVAHLQQAIASGTYTVDPQKIAERMVALETPFRS